MLQRGRDMWRARRDRIKAEGAASAETDSDQAVAEVQAAMTDEQRESAEVQNALEAEMTAGGRAMDGASYESIDDLHQSVDRLNTQRGWEAVALEQMQADMEGKTIGFETLAVVDVAGELFAITKTSAQGQDFLRAEGPFQETERAFLDGRKSKDVTKDWFEEGQE